MGQCVVVLRISDIASQLCKLMVLLFVFALDVLLLVMIQHVDKVIAAVDLIIVTSIVEQ